MREVNFERMEAARQSNLPIGDRNLTITRPSPWDVLTAQASGQRLDIEWAAGYVVGWDFTEADLMAGGDPEPVAFNAKAFTLWIKDEPKHWKALVDGVKAVYQAHEKALNERGNA